MPHTPGHANLPAVPQTPEGLPEGAQPEGQLPAQPLSEALAATRDCAAKLLRKHGLQGRVVAAGNRSLRIELSAQRCPGDTLRARFVRSVSRAALAARSHAVLDQVDDDITRIGISVPEGAYELALALRGARSATPPQAVQFLISRPESLAGRFSWASDEWRLVDRVLREAFAGESPLEAEDAVAMLREKGAKVYLHSDDAGDSAGSGWAAVGGYDAAKAALVEHLQLPLTQRQLLAAVQRATRSQHVATDQAPGVLLHGPPGTGKTTIARIAASEAGKALVYLPLESIVAKWYGQSEERLATVFKLAAALGGAILFLDEIDALGHGRGCNTHEASRRVLSTLLRHMDGLQTCDSVSVVGATNRPQDLDPALRSRFAAHVALELPSASDRASIWALYANHLSGAEHRRLAARSAGMSGRDIRSACAAVERRWAAQLTSKQLPACPPPPELYADSALAKESAAAGWGGEGEKAADGAVESQRVAELERALARAEGEAREARDELYEVKHLTFPHGASSLPSSRRASPKAQAARGCQGRAKHPAAVQPRGGPAAWQVHTAAGPEGAHRSCSETGEDCPAEGSGYLPHIEHPQRAGMSGEGTVSRSGETRPAPDALRQGAEEAAPTPAQDAGPLLVSPVADAVSDNAPRVLLEYAANAWLGQPGVELAKLAHAAYMRRGQGPGNSA